MSVSVMAVTKLLDKESRLKPKAAFTLQDYLGVSREALSNLLGVSTRTLTSFGRRTTPLDLPLSNQVLRITRVLQDAEKTLGSRGKVLVWLARPNVTLANRVPLELLRTEKGAEAVMDVLAAIRYGTFG